MSTTTKIQWTDATWNPTVGCTKVSAGCENCYAETFVNRFAGSKGFPERFDRMVLRDHFLELPLRWRKPQLVFVNSLSDLFHDDVPDEFIAKVFAVMAATPHHTYQLLTKRHGRMRSLLSAGEFFAEVLNEAVEALGMPGIPWPLPNVWLGVSAENEAAARLRIPALLGTPAKVRWLSAEPLIGPLPACVGKALDWVVVGGESGVGARNCELGWILNIVGDCRLDEVPVFVKQLGSVQAKRLRLTHIKGGDISEWPEHLQVRQYPGDAA